MCFGFLCLWPDQSEFMALLMVFNLWIGPGFIVGNSWWICHLMKEGHVSMERKNDLEGSCTHCLMFSCIKG